MRILLQRVLKAEVAVAGQTVGKIGPGYLLFLGIAQEDTKEIADKMMEKVAKLRLFEDENGKTNRDIHQADGSVLLVSQFTLYADCKKGNRPSFTSAGNPQMAEQLYDYICQKSTALFSRVECGSFGADMKVSLINDGPFTVLLDSAQLF